MPCSRLQSGKVACCRHRCPRQGPSRIRIRNAPQEDGESDSDDSGSEDGSDSSPDSSDEASDGPRGAKLGVKCGSKTAARDSSVQRLSESRYSASSDSRASSSADASSSSSSSSLSSRGSGKGAATLTAPATSSGRDPTDTAEVEAHSQRRGTFIGRAVSRDHPPAEPPTRRTGRGKGGRVRERRKGEREERRERFRRWADGVVPSRWPGRIIAARDRSGVVLAYLEESSRAG